MNDLFFIWHYKFQEVPMKKISFLSILLIVFLSFNSCKDKCDYDTDLETSKIETVLEKYVIANETQNLELVKKVWAPQDDIIVFGTTSDEKLVGWDNIQETMERQFGSFKDTYISVSDQYIKINETGNADCFAEVINYNFIYNGEARSYEGVRFTGVMRKIDEEWYIVQSHMSVPDVPFE